jgi:hypothetical protein
MGGWLDGLVDGWMDGWGLVGAAGGRMDGFILGAKIFSQNVKISPYTRQTVQKYETVTQIFNYYINFPF